jgi:hypothetical protein
MRTGRVLRSVSVLTIAFGGLICHRWPCMLLNVRSTLFSNPTLSANFQITAKHAGSVITLLIFDGHCY